MREAKVQVYRFDELDDDAKATAKGRHAEIFGYWWDHDALASLRAFAAHFGATLNDYSIDWFEASRCRATFRTPFYAPEEEELAELVAALGDGTGQCVLTGYCADEDAIDGLRESYNEGERDLGELLRAGCESWIVAVTRDCESQYSDEVFGEHADANEYEYTERGELWG